MRHPKMFAAVLAALSTPALAGTVYYSDATTPACTSTQLSRHATVVNQQQGLDVYDPAGHYIGWNEADGIFWRNWEPVDAYKHAFCGVQHHYSFYDPWYSGDEDDANKYMLPASGYASMITNPIAWGLSDAEDVHRCDGAYCLEAEVTHDQSYAGNPWYPHVDGAGSPLNGRLVCTYGPWIADHGHGGRPEIHPSEGLWWKTTPVPAGVIEESRLILMQDDSNRYDRHADFTPDLPSYIKPWSAWPRTELVRQAFSVATAGTARVYLHVYEGPRNRNITTWNNASLHPDATAGIEHTLAYNGVARITVVEHQPDSNLGVVFDENASVAGTHDVCRRSDGTLQGYVTLRTQFGVDDRGGEGYHELVVRRTAGLVDTAGMPKAAAASATNAAPVERVRVDPASLRFERTAQGARLVGDLLVELERGAKIVAVRNERGAALGLGAEPKAASGAPRMRLRDLDLAREQRLVVDFGGGATSSSNLLGLTVAAELSATPRVAPAPAAELDAAWNALVASIGADATPRPALFAHLAHWDVAALPMFAPRKKGRDSREDKFHLADLLNDAARDGKHAALTLDRALESVTWSDGAAAKDTSAWQRTVALGPALAERDVALEMTDVFGGRFAEKTRVSSHGLAAPAAQLARDLPALVAALAGTPAFDPIARAKAASADHDASYSDSALRERVYARLIARSSRDGVVVPAELKVLVTLAREID